MESAKKSQTYYSKHLAFKSTYLRNRACRWWWWWCFCTGCEPPDWTLWLHQYSRTSNGRFCGFQEHMLGWNIVWRWSTSQPRGTFACGHALHSQWWWAGWTCQRRGAGYRPPPGSLTASPASRTWCCRIFDWPPCTQSRSHWNQHDVLASFLCLFYYHSKLFCMMILVKLVSSSSSMVLHFSFFSAFSWVLEIVKLVPRVLKWYFTDPLRLWKVWWCFSIQWGKEHCFSWVLTGKSKQIVAFKVWSRSNVAVFFV